MSVLGQELAQAGRELAELDRAVYAAVHATPTPTVDHAVARVSRAADRSRIWLSVAVGMGVLGRRPRHAALVGLAAVGVTSLLVNLAVKPVVRRERPTRLETVRTHVVDMPLSASYPSGHAASAFAFSVAAGGGVPELDTALRLLATTVAYSRVHTGVHYPGDVVAGALIGAGIGTVARHVAERTGFVRRHASGVEVPVGGLDLDVAHPVHAAQILAPAFTVVSPGITPPSARLGRQ